MTLLDPVLDVVLLAQLGILCRCWFLARGDDSEALDGLWKQFKHDIIGRAHRGDSPDWVRYMDEADRVHERRIDRLRVWATAALVVGIGGTMAALAIRLAGAATDDQPSSGAALGGLIAAVGPALWASLSGVANNLLVTLWLFHWSDRQFKAALDDFRQALQICSDENTPVGQFADAVREQLGQAFREAVRSFPDAFARLDESVTHLAQVNKEQSQSMVKAATGLQGGVDSLADAVEKITPLSELLHATTSELRTVPDQLRQTLDETRAAWAQTLDETRAAWAQEMRRDEEAFIGGARQVLDDQRALLESIRDAFHRWERGRRDSAEQQQATWRETVELVQKASAEIVGTVERLPAVFTGEVERISGTLGKEFSLGAQRHVAVLRDSAERQQATWRETVELMRKTSAEIVSTVERLPGLFRQEVERISGTLGKEFSLGAQQHVADLRKEIGEGNRALGERIEAASRELQNRFLNDTRRVVGESAEEVNRRVGEPLLSALQKVSRGVEEALSTLPENAATFAASLSAADEKLGRAIDRLRESAGHLQKAAKLTQDFENALTRALEEATVRSFEPIRREMKDLAAELRRFARRADVPASAGFFRRLFRRLWRRRTDSESSR